MAEQIERLVTVWDARFDRLEEKLNKAVRATYGAASKMEKRLDAVNDNVASKFKRNIGREFSAGLDEVGSRAGRAAGLLDGFGAAGLAATAVLGALTVAAGKATEAMAFGDELQTAADKIQISAEALQELQFAADETDVPIEALRGNLEKLNGTIGLLKRDLAGKKITNAFAQLGITKETLKDVHDANDLLPILADRLGQVRDTASQVAIAKRLGVEDLLPLLRQGSDGLEEMRQRAHELGLVLSNETVKSLADADRQMELAGQQINTSLRGAFAGLATDIAAATTKLAEFMVFLRNSDSAWAVFGRAARDALVNNPFFNPVGFARQVAGAGQNRATGYTPVTAAGIRNAVGPATTKPGAGFQLRDTPSGGSGRSTKDKSDQEAQQRRQRERQVANDIYRAELDLLRLHNNENRSVEDRLAFTLERLDLERRHRKLELDQLEADFARTKGLEGISAAERKTLEAKEAEARGAEEYNAKQDAARDLIDQRLRYEQDLTDYALDVLGVQSSLATTQAERRKVQLEILETERRIARKALEEELSRNANLSPEERAVQLGGFDRATDAQRRGVIADTRGPIEQFVFDNTDAKKAAEDFQRLTVDAFENLSDGLAEAILNAESLGDVAKNVFRQLIAELLASQIKSSIGSIVGALKIPGFASGTNFAPGGLAWVGEYGRELVNLPRGSQVIPTHQLPSLPRPAGKGGDVNLHISVMAAGAIPREEIISMVRQGSVEAVSAARQLASADARKRQFHADLNA